MYKPIFPTTWLLLRWWWFRLVLKIIIPFKKRGALLNRKISSWSWLLFDFCAWIKENICRNYLTEMNGNIKDWKSLLSPNPIKWLKFMLRVRSLSCRRWLGQSGICLSKIISQSISHLPGAYFLGKTKTSDHCSTQTNFNSSSISFHFHFIWFHIPRK